jgi:4-amino-4-deoxy-L-arabinose transferase-like glycosyltransferase
LTASRVWAAAAVIAAFFLFFYELNGTGLLGPDEPRYAAIGREMARSGDWLTPRLWGEPWFEKPPLLYWMTAAGFRLGLGDETAPRLPVALASVLFLAFFYCVLRRESLAPAWSTAILATTAGWLAFSRIGATDLPMAAAFSAAMLLAMGWIERGETRRLPAAAALLGLAVLAKGLVPLVLALPALWMGRRRLRDLVRPAPVLAFLAVAAPWYVAMTVLHGNRFVDEFFWKHHLARFASEALQHRQPVWFYVPVLLGGLFPWTPLAVLLFRKAPYRDPRRRFLLAWVLFGFAFFSAATNKLPGYLLPLLPAAAVLMGAALAEAGSARWPLAGCALLVETTPVAAAVLPEALRRGITHAAPPAIAWEVTVAAAVLVAAVVWVLETRGRRPVAVAALVAAMTGGAVWLERTVFPALDRDVSARVFWSSIAPRRAQVCVGEVNRGWRYNLNYYSNTPLEDCAVEPRPLRIEQSWKQGARLERSITPP